MENPLNTEDLMTTKDAAAEADLSPTQISWLLRQGKLQGKKLGRDWLVSRASVLAYKNQWNKPGPKPKEPRGTEGN